MANLARRLEENVAGDFFVDATCIDCDACRQIAPTVFRDHGDQSSVYHQPETEEEIRLALMSLAACPTGSIGTTRKYDTRIGVNAFPTPISENVYFCGFTSESSFGAWSYLIVRPDSEGGNVLVDSPRFTTPLVKRIEQMGGVNLMFLSHQDDIADHIKFAAHFHCPRVMHEGDGAAARGIERVVIPVPGHTRGHIVLLYKNKFLFTGDHLAWSPARETLTAFRSVCWYSWSEQTRSMEKLLDYDFEWVLPGHGRIHHDTLNSMRSSLRHCIEWMKTTP